MSPAGRRDGCNWASACPEGIGEIGEADLFVAAQALGRDRIPAMLISAAGDKTGSNRPQRRASARRRKPDLPATTNGVQIRTHNDPFGQLRWVVDHVLIIAFDRDAKPGIIE